MGCGNNPTIIHIKRGDLMNKTVYAIILLILLLVGISSFAYGLFMIWQPLAYMIGGLFLIILSIILNQAYDNTSERGEK